MPGFVSIRYAAHSPARPPQHVCCCHLSCSLHQLQRPLSGGAGCPQPDRHRQRQTKHLGRRGLSEHCRRLHIWRRAEGSRTATGCPTAHANYRAAKGAGGSLRADAAMKHNFIDKNRCRSCQHGCPLLALLLPPQPRMWRLLPPPPRLRCAINLCSHPGSQRAGASGCNCAPGHSTAASAALLLLCCCCCSTAACTPAAAPCCPLPPPAAAWTWPPPRPRCPPPPPPHRPAIRGFSAKACQLAVVDARPSKGSRVCRCIAQRSSAQQHAWAQAACIGACRAAHPQKTIPSLAMQCKGSRSTAGNWPQATKRWMRATHLIALLVIVLILILIILIVLQQKKLAGQAD